MGRPTSPSNESFELVPVFGVDPRGAALFAGVINGTLGRLGGRAVIDANDDPWHGWTQPPQSFRGSGYLGGGRPVLPRGNTLDQERGMGASPMQSILEQRMTARRFG